MPRVSCPMCHRMLNKAQLAYRIGDKSFYTDFSNFHGINSDNYSPDQKICGKCNAKVRNSTRVVDENRRLKFQKSNPSDRSASLQLNEVHFIPTTSCHSGALDSQIEFSQWNQNVQRSFADSKNTDRVLDQDTPHSNEIIDPQFLLLIPDELLPHITSQFTASQRVNAREVLRDLPCSSLQSIKKDYILKMLNLVDEDIQPVVDGLLEPSSSNVNLIQQEEHQTDVSQSIWSQDNSNFLSSVDTASSSQAISEQIIPSQPTSLQSMLSSHKYLRTRTSTITLPKIDSVKRSEKSCFICGDKSNRCRIPPTAILHLWTKYKIWVPPNNRSCKVHIKDKMFVSQVIPLIQEKKVPAKVTPQEISNWMFDITQFLDHKWNPLNFDLSSGLSDSDYITLTGYDMSDFEKLLSYLSGSVKQSPNRSVRNALAIFLMKMRLNMSQNVIKILFGIENQSVISDTIDVVSAALMEKFVPEYLGFHHLSREQILENHMRPFFSSVLGLHPNDLILILDGTYLYVQKASDFEMQRKTYSLHKLRNLVKPMMVVCPNGYVIEAEGLFFADHSNNDAAILRQMLRKEDSIVTILETGDCLVLDRGFRDVIGEIEKMGIKTVMPCLLDKKEKQFSTDKANESRKVTMLRWVVEAVNGRLKNKFRFFDHVIPTSYFPNLNRFLRIACAMMNAFSPPIFNQSDWHDDVLSQIEERMKDVNVLKTKVQEMQLEKRSPIWEEADEDCLLDFPALSLDELKSITLGPYQLEMGKLYNDQHYKTGGGYKYFVHREMEDLIRVRLQSRFSRRQSHILWIQFTKNGQGADSIRGWYCRCKVGSRTLGCCSHTAAVLMYLSHDRFEPQPARRDFASSFLDAAEALAQIEDSDEENSDEEGNSDDPTP